MENSDVEEIIPPTPNVKKVVSKLFCLKQTSSSSNHINKCSLKRKRNTSSDVQNVKQKVKQLTLHNFFINRVSAIPNNNIADTVKKKIDVIGLDNSKNVSSEKDISVLDYNKENTRNSKLDLPSAKIESDKSETANSFQPKVENSNANSILKLNDNINICASELECLKNIKGNKDKVDKCFSSDVSDLISRKNEYDTKNTFDHSKFDLNLNANIPKVYEALPINKYPLSSKTNLNLIQDELIGKEPQITSCNLILDVKCPSENPAVNCSQEKHKMQETTVVNNNLSLEDTVWNTEEDLKIEDFSFRDNSLFEDFSFYSSPEDTSIKFKVVKVEKISQGHETKLFLLSKYSSKICILRGFWTDSIVATGDTVHILKTASSNNIVIDDNSGFLVVNPDFLISSTAVVSTLFCMRKAVLNHILPHWSAGNSIMMIGSLVHDIFQKSINIHVDSSEDILKIVDKVIKKRENLVAMCCQDMPESEIKEKITKYIPNILDWIFKYCKSGKRNASENILIRNVEDIEENIWCPKYGVKGKIDMTVNVNLKKEAITKCMPLELKTGRPTYSAEHIGQVNLYSLMMEERSKETSDGLLLYLREKAEMKVISSNHHSKRGLIQLRNELAKYVYKWMVSSNSYEDIEHCHLPKPINNKRLCEKCPYLLPCSIYQKVFSEETQLEPSHAMNTLNPLSTNHLSACHLEYFSHWSRLLLLENTTAAEAKAFWIDDSLTREKMGMCISYVMLDVTNPPRQDPEAEYFIHTFVRHPVSSVSNFKNISFKDGDYVAISNQESLDEVAVAMGYIFAVSEECIELAIDRNLKSLSRLKNCIFRIDKQISNSAAACVRNNLMLLMENSDFANKLRKLVIEKIAPVFLESLPKQIAVVGRPILKSLNKIQQKAVLKAVMAEDYFLIKGMPGTGKTSTIVALVRLLVKLNFSVLLTSYTHSAVDNILLKLKEHESFLRLGPKYRMHAEIRKYSFETLTSSMNSADEFSAFMKNQVIVATTCLGVNHAIFKLRKFDICIVDEASQINQIACLGPLYYAKKFILVGDDKQLPPLVLNNDARQKGLQESLFQRLQTTTSCIELSIQYRMNKEIMRLCNELTYNGSLECGSETVANAYLQLDNLDIKKYPSWITCAFDKSLKNSVVFLNNDKSVTNDSKVQSELEADTVVLLVEVLLENNISQQDIGVIAPYRKQVDLIESNLKAKCWTEIEVNTVDQYQGRDKDVIIISFVKPNDSVSTNQKAGILDDEKRLNVAISRAKKKLVLIGSRTSLVCYEPFNDLINLLRTDQIINIV